MKICGMCETNLVLSNEFGGMCSQECLDAAKAFIFETLMGASAKTLLEMGEEIPELKEHFQKAADAEIKQSGGSKL